MYLIIDLADILKPDFWLQASWLSYTVVILSAGEGTFLCSKQ